MTKTKIALTILVGVIYLISILGLCSALVINSVTTSPDQIAPGETTDIGIALKNNADEDISDVSINLDLKDLPLAPFDSGSQYGFDAIESGKTKQVAFKLVAFNDASSGIYKIPVVMSYRDINNELVTKQSLISIMVNSEPVIDVSLEDGLFLKGQNNKITIKVINKGLADVKFLEINLGNSAYYTLLSSNKIYVGDVDNNDFQTNELTILVKDNAPSTLTIPFNIVYQDVTNKEYNENKDVSLKVYTNEEAVNLGLLEKSYTTYYVLGIIALILIFILSKAIRNSKRLKE
ncbi:MAG: hypothetical protein WC979_03660 [Candidatus Pacearchaeota archaeon]|jgi:hypothetical protein